VKPDKPLRVAVDARSLLCSQPRGEGKSLLRLYQEIVRLRPDTKVVLFGDDHARRYEGELPQSARVVALSAVTHRVDLWENFFFPLSARANGCTVMHCTSSGAPALATLPIVMTVHDLIPVVFDDGHDATSQARFTARLNRGVRRARRIVAVSEHTRLDLQARHPSAAAKTEVVHWGSDRVDRPASPLGSPPSVLLFGGEARRKNTEYSVQRFIAAAARVPALCLTVIGITSASQRALLQAMLDAAGLHDRAEILGFVTEQQLAERLGSAAVLLYLSLYEGFGLPVLEAIGMGLPVIASDRSSLPELLRGAPGLHALDDPIAIEHTLVYLGNDADARADYVRAQQAVLDRFAWSATASRYIEALEAAA
jgi:glycosyltransferase involved in cell wall biosynthesis